MWYDLLCVFARHKTSTNNFLYLKIAHLKSSLSTILLLSLYYSTRSRSLEHTSQARREIIKLFQTMRTFSWEKKLTFIRFKRRVNIIVSSVLEISNICRRLCYQCCYAHRRTDRVVQFNETFRMSKVISTLFNA